MKHQLMFLFLAIVLSVPARSDVLSEWVGSEIDEHEAEYSELAMDLWRWSELGYREVKSSRAMQQQLGSEGFEIERSVAGLPTAFVASYGQGEPIIGVLAEFDALPGLSQVAEPIRKARVEGAAGQACGHHLFGSGSTAAAITVAKWLKKNGKSGTIRLYGTPAEEGGSGKVYMVREGLFEDVDTVLHWHPADRNASGNATTLANKSAKFRFSGIASHASAAPEMGRSALDGVEAMNSMVNQLREHVPTDTRIHYVITDGGDVPNVVPAHAEVYYMVRSSDAGSLSPIWNRVEQAARGAAMGTGTEVNWEVIHGNHSTLPNRTLSEKTHGFLDYFGGVVYNEEEKKFSQTIQATYTSKLKTKLPDAATILPYSRKIFATPASTDVGDVSWYVPTTGLMTATWVPGTSPHSWQAVAAGGMSIGHKGMLLAAKVIARTAIDLIESPDTVARAKVEFEERRGEGFVYEPLLGDRDPPLDYRAPKSN
ncbi:MAG: amidohydrolase [Gammaproteobacteria bacterium]|jgi:aminobenzoyl-glutamate utilization protein B|nr:amidohydrolase [Gammaproteobacteria bacterium]